MNEQVIAETIDYLVAHYSEAPDLNSLARRAGYEPTYFQKLFRDKVGISPKRLIQYMNARHARDLLMKDHGLAETADMLGLSGTGRLHDLFVSCEGLTPGHVKVRGAGLHVHYGFHESELGAVMVAQSPRGVCYLGFVMDGDKTAPVRRMRDYLPRAQFTEDASVTAENAEKILSVWRGQMQAPDNKIRLDLYGTNLQLQVWQALLKIPAGQTQSYGDIAAALGRAKAARAIGNAVGANPVSLLIPCHRVIRASGIIDNYGWGSARKKLILGLESECRADQK